MAQAFKLGRYLAATVVLYFAALGASVAAPVSVDTRIELAAVAARLAGFEEFNATGIPAYDADVEGYFGRFRNHPTINLLRDLRLERNVGFGDTVALALVARRESWKPTIDLEAWLPRSSTNWDVASAARMLEALSRFELDTGAQEFFAAHAPLYEKAAKQLNDDLHDPLDEAWFQRVSGSGVNVRMTIIVGLLHGRGNYGPRIFFPDGTVDAYAVIGTPALSAGEPLQWSGPQASRLLVHEFTHSFVNPWVDANVSALQPGASALYASTATAMRRNAYGDWRTLLYESVTRAITLRYFLDHDLLEQARAAEQEDVQRGFTWTHALANVLSEASRTGPLLATDVVPDVASFLAAQVGRVPDVTATASASSPHAVLLPADGDMNVDPCLARLTVRFDRPMAADIGVFGDQVPEFAGAPSWSDDAMELHMPVELRPGKGYQLELNHSAMPGGFRSRDGTLLEPVSWVFHTRVDSRLGCSD